MDIQKIIRSCWGEAIVDTIIAVCMNFPLNVILLWSCTQMDFSVLKTSITMTCVFTVIAVVRKATVRKYFDNKIKQ